MYLFREGDICGPSLARMGLIATAAYGNKSKREQHDAREFKIYINSKLKIYINFGLK